MFTVDQVPARIVLCFRSEARITPNEGNGSVRDAWLSALQDTADAHETAVAARPGRADQAPRRQRRAVRATAVRRTRRMVRTALTGVLRAQVGGAL